MADGVPCRETGVRKLLFGLRNGGQTVRESSTTRHGLASVRLSRRVPVVSVGSPSAESKFCSERTEAKPLRGRESTHFKTACVGSVPFSRAALPESCVRVRFSGLKTADERVHRARPLLRYSAVKRQRGWRGRGPSEKPKFW